VSNETVRQGSRRSAGRRPLFARTATAPTAYDFGAIDPARHPRLTAALTGRAGGEPMGDLFERTVRALIGGLLGDAAG
jgi:hypothetical protein